MIEVLSELERGLVGKADVISKLKEEEKRHAKVVSSIISRVHAASEEFYIPKRSECVLYIFSIQAYQDMSKEYIAKVSERFRVLVVSFSRPCYEFNVDCIEHSIDKRSENQFSSVHEVMILLERYPENDLIILDSLPALSVISGYDELKKFIYYLIKKVKSSGKSLVIFTIKGTISGEIETFVATLCDKTVTLE